MGLENSEAFGIGVLAGMVLLTGGLITLRYNSLIREVQEGYVVPVGIGIDARDLDGNGELETILSYEGRDYLLTLDEQGRPRIQDYDVRPAESYSKRLIN